MGRRGDPGFAGSLGARRLHPGLFLGVAALSGLRMEVAWAEEVSALRGSCAALKREESLRRGRNPCMPLNAPFE